MPQFIQDDVRDVMADPAHGEAVVLVVGLDPGADADVVAKRLRDAGAEIDDERPFDTLVVSVAEENVAALAEVDGVSSIEFDRECSTDPTFSHRFTSRFERTRGQA